VSLQFCSLDIGVQNHGRPAVAARSGATSPVTEGPRRRLRVSLAACLLDEERPTTPRRPANISVATMECESSAELRQRFFVLACGAGMLGIRVSLTGAPLALANTRG
jgi:hypothetical protein